MKYETRDRINRRDKIGAGGSCIRPSGYETRMENGVWKFDERPMILRKLNQIRPDQTKGIYDTGFTIYESWFAIGRSWSFVDSGCGRKRRRRCRSAAAVHDALRANQGPRVYAKVEDRRRHKVSAALTDTVASTYAKRLRRDGARQCPPPKGKFGCAKKPMNLRKSK